MFKWQQTIKKSVSITGVGLHTGQNSTLTFKPAKPNTGYKIIRKDLPGDPEIKPIAEYVVNTQRGIVLSKDGVKIYTLEHVLAALVGLGIDNCILELDAEEPPIRDGSAKDFVELLLLSGRQELQAYPREYYVVESGGVKSDNKYITAETYSGFKINYTLKYPNTWIKDQQAEVEITEENFINLIAQARTFCFEHEIAWLKDQGLAKGGNLDNALVISKNGIKNPPLRNNLELVYHKILDLIGDLALLGLPIKGFLKAKRSGHEMNVKLVKYFKNKLNNVEGRM